MDAINDQVIPVIASRPPAEKARPADGGPPLGENEAVPMPATYSFDDLLRGLNPLHHLPVVGMIYRAATGETIPAPSRIAGSMATSALFGGPLGVLGTVVTSFVEELIRIGPDPRIPKWGETPPIVQAGLFDTTPGQGSG